MAAETLKCPSCGANASTADARCSYCGAALATVSCPSCFGLMFAGAKFCSHCGAAADRKEVAYVGEHLCPRCKLDMKGVTIGTTILLECPKCEGIWADVASFLKICQDREQQTAVLGMLAPAAQDAQLEKNIRYLPCPQCHNLMNRVNFAHCSHVIVDVCKAHGTWFDKDELRRIVEFIRGGGMEKARAHEMAELEAKRHELALAQSQPGAVQFTISSDSQYRDPGASDIADIADFVLSLFRK